MSAISVNNLSIMFNVRFLNERMTFRRYVMQLYQQWGRKKAGVQAPKRSATTHFWALRDLTFSIERGETVGLIGANGAGKSTLLMALAGIYKPDHGSVETAGTIGTLLSLDAGFNCDLTGRENIELNGLFMGLSRQQILERTEEIIEFSELGAFINAPLKTYSSGMLARLGFSIAISIDPDIVLIDEVIEAGDAGFNKKAGNLLEHFKDMGKTVVIATHNLSLITEKCSRAFLIDHGTLLADGPAQEIVERYYRDLNLVA